MSRRKVLCLHGAQLSGDLFKLQLRPYMSTLEREHGFQLHFVDGPVVTAPETSIASFWDAPCYRWFHWAPSPTPFAMTQVRAAYEHLEAIIAKHGPFDGVIGFSQGAILSVAFLLHRQATQPDEDPPFGFAILFSAPHLPNRDGEGPDAPELKWGRITVPSLHVAGEADEEWFVRSRQTYEENCSRGSARWIAHKGGHAVPKERAVVEQVLRGVEDLLQRAED